MLSFDNLKWWMLIGRFRCMEFPLQEYWEVLNREVLYNHENEDKELYAYLSEVERMINEFKNCSDNNGGSEHKQQTSEILMNLLTTKFQ